jgi:hypothetical protein
MRPPAYCNRTIERREYLFVLAGVISTYRSVVDQCNIHHGRELAILDLILAMQVLYLLVETMVQGSSLVTTCRLVEVWLIAFFCGSK